MNAQRRNIMEISRKLSKMTDGPNSRWKLLLDEKRSQLSKSPRNACVAPFFSRKVGNAIERRRRSDCNRDAHKPQSKQRHQLRHVHHFHATFRQTQIRDGRRKSRHSGAARDTLQKSGISSYCSPSVPSATICMVAIVRVFEGNDSQPITFSVNANNCRPSPSVASFGHQLAAANIESNQNCMQILLLRVDCCWSLVVSGVDHSVADELRKDFCRGAEQCLQVPLSEQYFPPKQWAHLAIVVSRPSLLLKSSNVYNCEVFINGHSLASQKLQLCWHSADSGVQQPTLNVYIGTLPFFRRCSIQLRWRMDSLCLVEEALCVDVLRKIVALGVAYTGNYQTTDTVSAPSASCHSALIPEEKILLSLNASTSAETNALSLRSMMPCRTDTELVASLVGISPNDQSTPLGLLWNITSCPTPCRPVPLGAVLIGYFGIRTFGPCPVSTLLDSVGGMPTLLGTVVMSSDFSGLYASLKVRTNRSIFAEMQRMRGFQTLAVLLEDKVSLMNSRILHLIFTLAGTVDDGSNEQVLILDQQIFEDLLCDLNVWRDAPRDVWKLLLGTLF